MQKSSSTVDQPLWRREYPFAPRYLQLNDGLRMHYVDEGDGRPVVMVHGNPTWSFFFRNLLSGLSEHGRRAIAPDHIGCGLSDKPQDYPYRLINHIDNLERLLDFLEIEACDLIVHDWGGAIGLGWAVRHPHKVGRIVVLNSAAFLVPRCPWRIRICRCPLLGPLLIQGCNGFARAALRMAVAKPKNLSAAARQGYLAPYNNYRNRIANLRFVQDIPLSPSHPTWRTMKEIENGLGQLQDKPMRICWGMRDFCFTPRFLERWLQFFPRADAHRLTDAGHYILEDAPSRIEPLVTDFLAPEKDQ